jgi:hypothetical protein
MNDNVQVMEETQTEKRIVVNHRYTYITLLDLKIGDEVIVPSPSWLSDVNPTWTATVTKLTSDYDGYCLRVISKIQK